MWDVQALRATSPTAVPLKSSTIRHNVKAETMLELNVCMLLLLHEVNVRGLI
jgi:hypothetical protein